MYIEENGWMLELIFDLSSQALIQMINQLFHTAYSDEEKIWKEWQRANSIGLKVGETNRYEFQVRRLDGCTQIYAEDRGSVFAWGRSVDVLWYIFENHRLFISEKTIRKNTARRWSFRIRHGSRCLHGS